MELRRKLIGADALRYNRLPLEELYSRHNTTKLTVAMVAGLLTAGLVILMIFLGSPL
jgi:hypothetical protein